MEDNDILRVKKNGNNELIFKFSENTTGTDIYRILLTLINQIRIRQNDLSDDKFIEEINKTIKEDYLKYYKGNKNNE